MYYKLKSILDALIHGDLNVLNSDNIIAVSNEALRLLEKEKFDPVDILNCNMIISMSQIVYNNTDRSILFLDDGIYDLLLEKDKGYNENFQVGSPVVEFNQDGEIQPERELKEPLYFVDNFEDFKINSLYFDQLMNQAPIYPEMFTKIDRNSGRLISKKNVNVPHKYPKLVGSLDKCKFTLNQEAIDKGVFDDPNVKIFERDFLQKHLEMGLIDFNTPFEMVAELKYDGVSVEADVTDHIISARSRGDANNDIAADLTPIFEGYKFPFAPSIPDNESFGMKFEAIMLYRNLDKMGMLKGKYYKNSRNGIIGLLGASDAYDYRDLITLVPLETSMENLDRVDEIEFLNKYYNSGEYLRYAILRGNYNQILYQVYKFVKEAETIRNILPFMYDGVVISYRDPKIRSILGRANSINKYSMAIKFNPLVRETIFTGYTFTVGQDGKITPLIHYTPIEFLGGIHTKSSGHSYKRFMDLGLAIGDIIQVEYTNDVMPYVTKPDVQANRNNPNPPVPFPTNCPFCGGQIYITDSGKTAECVNIKCPERIVSKMTNMMRKMNIKDFGEETFRLLKTKSLAELLSYNYEDVKILGPLTAEKLMGVINAIRTTPAYDYLIIGSIGFSGVAVETWKRIFKFLNLNDICDSDPMVLYDKLINIHGIGPKTANTIVTEREFLYDDLNAIRTLIPVQPSYSVVEGKVIRYTGCRPTPQLTDYLISKGCDARPDGGVTKSTNILVVPYIGFSSNKTMKVGTGCVVVDYASFEANPDRYLAV